jgi:hypothetical protein
MRKYLVVPRTQISRGAGRSGISGRRRRTAQRPLRGPWRPSTATSACARPTRGRTGASAGVPDSGRGRTARHRGGGVPFMPVDCGVESARCVSLLTHPRSSPERGYLLAHRVRLPHGRPLSRQGRSPGLAGEGRGCGCGAGRQTFRRGRRRRARRDRRCVLHPVRRLRGRHRQASRQQDLNQTQHGRSPSAARHRGRLTGRWRGIRHPPNHRSSRRSGVRK